MTTSVDVQGMQLAQQDFQQALDQMNSVYSAMTEEQDTLTANWSGMAASAFGQALGAWLDDLYQIRQELVVMTESLSTHTGIYSDANETSQQVVTAFQQGLDGLEGLPVDGMVAGRSVEGTLLPERGVMVRRMAVEGTPLLPGRVEAEQLPSEPGTPLLPGRVEAEQLPSEPGTPLLREAVEGVPAGVVLPAETQPGFLDREEPLLPTLRLEDAREEPLQPALRDLPRSPLSP